MERCPQCRHKYAKYPLKDENGKLILKNMFKMDWTHVMFLVAVVLMIWGYTTDTQSCRDILENPMEFCESGGDGFECYHKEPKEDDNQWITNLPVSNNTFLIDG